MIKHLLISVLFALVVPACATDLPDDKLVELSTGKGDTWKTTPKGNYEFDTARNGAASSGDLLTLSLSPNGTFKSTVSDELSGTTSHTGTYKLFKSAATSVANFYIVFYEGSKSYRFEYSIDVVDNATLWLRQTPSGSWYGMWSLGDDCSVSGCATGEHCSECFGENVCLPQGTDC